jgi:hypothetical protein
MSKTELESARAELRKLLPESLRNLLMHYNMYIAEELPHGTKEFNAFHAAGKNAIGHIQLLLRLYNMLGADRDLDEDLRAELAQVMSELEAGDA